MSDLIARAKEFASIVHRNQKYGEQLYVSHLRDVYYTLRGLFKVEDEAILASAWLHDSVEDCWVSHETLEIQFGKEVADIVYAITNTPAKNRVESLKKTAEKLKTNKKALMVKLVDRIVNTECSLDDNPKLFKMYEKEFPLFSELLRDKMEDNFTILYMWEYLEALYNQEEELSLEEIQLRVKRKKIENIEQYRKELDDTEDYYLDSAYQIVEERLYDS